MRRVVAITGAYGALGRAVAARFAADGARLALIDAQASPASSEPADSLHLGNVDLVDAQAAKLAIDTAATRLERIDVLVNVAGGFRWQAFADDEPQTWDTLHRLNLLTAVNASRAALPWLLRSGSGRIINIGALSAERPGAGIAAYTASKSAVHRFTQSLADEFKGHGLTVNAVLPSIIDTAANRESMPDADHGKWVQPEELANVIAFLASPQAGAITGALLPICGGL